MGHFYIERKRNKENHETVQGYANNTIQNTVKHHPKRDKQNKVVIYQMKYLGCPLK
jgi:hypothetical protein